MSELDWLKTSTPADPGKLVQGTEAWRAWRGKGLGSSDAPVLLGWSPWKTIEQLVLEKRGVWKQEFGPRQQSAMDRGKELEPKIRAWYEDREKAKFTEDTFEHPEHAFIRASYDGINRTIGNPDGSRGRVLEIKAPNAKDHELARQGVVPEKYEPQVQWLLMAEKMPWAAYVSYGTDDTYAVVDVKADPIMQAELLSRAIALWVLVKSPALPIPALAAWVRPAQVVALSLPDPEEIPTITEQETEQLAAETLKAQAEHVAAEARYEALKERLKAALGDRKKAFCGEAVLEWQEKKGNIDYAKIPELAGVDLEKYRKPKTKSFLFKRREDREP